jgi:UDP-2,3-diacylglucosamine pyrophosphatase LpxH
MEKALNKALKKAKKINLDVARDKYVVMSDQHLGDGKKGSDDFRLNRKTYKKALNYYYANGYRLISIGDSEELWECDFPKILRMYPDVYSLEKKFAVEGRLLRLYGNHDIFWKSESFVNKYLQSELPGITICEALLLKGKDGSIFLTHGHQGEFFSDVLWPVSRFFVRTVWKPGQRFLGFKNTGAAHNIKKRSKKEQMYYRWAKGKGLLFIAGHTHRAMFSSRSKVDRLKREIEDLIQIASTLSKTSKRYDSIMKEIKKKKAELQSRINREFGKKAVHSFVDTGIFSPCYFNDGCCSYNNGITALELDSGMIRLVKWDRGGKKNKPEIYEADKLRELFIKIEVAKEKT